MDRKEKSEYESYFDNLFELLPCEYCARLEKIGRGRRPDESDTGFVRESSCEAFPKGIPEDIMFGDFDHRKPHKGDHGLLFKPLRKMVLDGKNYLIGWRGIPEELK